MKAAEARQYSAQVLDAFRVGQSAKAISRQFKMHERHVAMILQEAGINPKAEYEKRLTDGTYKQALTHHYEHGDSWYLARYGKPKGYFDRQRDAKQKEREQHERDAALRKLTRLFDKFARQRKRDEQRAERERKDAETYAPKVVKCKHCGKEFVFYPSRERYGRKVPPIYCSHKCMIAHNRTGKTARERLIRYGRGDEHRDIIHLHDLVNRDCGICHICGEHIDWNDYKTDEHGNFICGAHYPTIDHVIPLIHGGTHTWDNVSLAHHLCNAVKGTNM